MNRPLVSSYPDLPPMASSSSNDMNLEGIATKAKLLLKLIQDHQETAHRFNDEAKEQRLSRMMTVLDELKTKIQATQSSGKKRQAELRRCYTDLRGNNPASSSREGPVLDEKDKLRRELNTSFAAQRRLGVMCSSLGKEKQIIARELALRVQELQELEEFVNGLKVQNDRLREKVKVCALEHKEKRTDGGMEVPVNVAALQERNKELSEQLLKTLECHRSLKRKLKKAQEDNLSCNAEMEELRTSGINLMQDVKERVAAQSQSNQQPADIKGQVREIESIFERLAMKLSKEKKDRNDQKLKGLSINEGDEETRKLSPW